MVYNHPLNAINMQSMPLLVLTMALMPVSTIFLEWLLPRDNNGSWMNTFAI